MRVGGLAHNAAIVDDEVVVVLEPRDDDPGVVLGALKSGARTDPPPFRQSIRDVNRSSDVGFIFPWNHVLVNGVELDLGSCQIPSELLVLLGGRGL